MAYVSVPKDLTKVKNKVAFNLTKKTADLYRDRCCNGNSKLFPLA